MTPSEREEIEKSVDRIMDKIMDLIDNDGRLSIDAEPIIAAEILTQVEKARAEAIEECAICAEDTKFLATCSERIVALVQLRHRIAKAIRRRLYD